MFDRTSSSVSGSPGNDCGHSSAARSFHQIHGNRSVTIAQSQQLRYGHGGASQEDLAARRLVIPNFDGHSRIGGEQRLVEARVVGTDTRPHWMGTEHLLAGALGSALGSVLHGQLFHCGAILDANSRVRIVGGGQVGARYFNVDVANLEGCLHASARFANLD